MTYQMRRMILVNVGTNVRTQSGRITEIDPRGGAAIVGANGVGKTSTLRLIPLFLGTSPGQILTPGKGQEAIISFALPTAHSAIAFEYQRGASFENDVRLAVIRRRQDGSDSAEYRFFKSGYREEFFAGNEYFLDDEESIDAARTLGVMVSQKLTGSDYRSVILGLRPNHKDGLKIRRLADEYSFGPKPLPNLDRLVAAMIKERVSFTDMIQVAVGMIHEELGSAVSQDRNRMALKQNKNNIATWLIDRDACAEAIKLKPQFEVLGNDLNEFAKLEIIFRGLRADVRALLAARQNDFVVLGEKLIVIELDREKIRETEARTKSELSQAWDIASKKEKAAKISWEEESDKQEYFVDQRASHWELRGHELSALNLTRKSLTDEIDSLNIDAKEIGAAYDEQINSLISNSSEEAEVLHAQKDSYREQADQQELAIASQSDNAINQHSLNIRRHVDELHEQKTSLISAQTRAQINIDTANNSKESQSIIDTAVDKLREHKDALLEAHRKTARLKETSSERKRECDQAEQNFSKSTRKVEQAREDLTQAQAMLIPADGSFLSTLRSHTDKSWVNNVAKIIDPLILRRSDLAPIFNPDGGADIYGWDLNLQEIAIPDWSSDGHLQKIIENAKADLALSEIAESNAKSMFSDASSRYTKAQQEFDTQLATTVSLENQGQSLNENIDVTRAKAQEEIVEARAHASAELLEILKKLKVIDGKIEDKRGEGERGFIEIQRRFSELRASAAQQRDESIKSIDVQIKTIKSNKERRIQEIQTQRDQDLAEKGIDVKKLANLNQQLQICKDDIELIEKNKPLVQSFLKWKASGGAALALNAHNIWIQERDHSLGAKTRYDTFCAEVAQQQEIYDSMHKKITTQRAQTEKDIAILLEQDEEFETYQPASTSVVDLTTSAVTIRVKVGSERSRLRNSRKMIEQEYQRLKNILCMRDSAVKTFVDTSLVSANASDPIGLASTLRLCHQRIGQQIISNINTSLTAMLNSIALFHQGIQGFETAVRQFNSKLQSGLSSVTEFERVRDVKIDLATNFQELDFVRKLDQINALARQHRAEIGRDIINDVPNEATAHVLRDFMSVIGNDGTLEVNLAAHVSLRGSVMENGSLKSFRRESELENVSSNGLTSIILITLLSGLLNMIRGKEDVHVPWVTDEVGKFDGPNFAKLMELLKSNHIDVITASPDLSVSQYRRFGQRYRFGDQGVIMTYAIPERRPSEA